MDGLFSCHVQTRGNLGVLGYGFMELLNWVYEDDSGYFNATPFHY